MLKFILKFKKMNNISLFLKNMRKSLGFFLYCGMVVLAIQATCSISNKEAFAINENQFYDREVLGKVRLDKGVDDKTNELQDKAVDSLGKLAEGVQKSFDENKGWFQSFIDKLKDNDFFKKIFNFLNDIDGWFNKIIRDIKDSVGG